MTKTDRCENDKHPCVNISNLKYYIFYAFYERVSLVLVKKPQ